MSKIELYGISFDLKTKEVVRSGAGLSASTTIPFKKLYSMGITRKKVMDIMINEYLRGRLDIEDFSKVMRLTNDVEKCLSVLPCSTIIILRSLFYDFDAIYELSSEVNKMGIKNWLCNEGIENPDIERVCGITNDRYSTSYIAFNKLKIA